MFLKKPLAWLKKVFAGAIEWLRPKATTAVKIVEIIKNLVESDTAGAIVAFTPTKVDDVLLIKMRQLLPAIISRLQVTGMILDKRDPDKMIASLIDYLRQQNLDVRAMFYVQLAAKITEALADGEIDRVEALAISQMIYLEIKSSKSTL